MKISIRTRLLVMCILLVLLTTAGISITYYTLTRKDKQRESRERIQIAFDIMLDDLANRLQADQQRFEVFLSADQTLRFQSYMFSHDKNLLNFVDGVLLKRSSIGRLQEAAEELKKFGYIVAADQLILYGADKRLLALYQSHEQQETWGGYVISGTGNATYLPMDGSVDLTAITTGATVPDVPLPSGIDAFYEAEIPDAISASLFSEGQKLGFRITAPVYNLGEKTGVLVGEVLYTQSTMERYALLSKTDINLFAGNHFSVGTLPAQKNLELAPGDPPLVACENLSDRGETIDLFPLTFNEQDYYQGQCALKNAQNIPIGAVTVSLSQEIETREIRKILTTVVIISGIGLVICVILVSGFVVPTFTSPILRLAQVASQMAKGDLEQKIETGRADELGILARGFAYMRDEIRKKIAELQQLNDELEQRVESRTAELTRQKSILETFMATVPDRIYFKDCEGRITRANNAHATGFGFDNPAEELGKTDFDFLPQELAQMAFAEEQEIFRTDKPLIDKELLIPKPDGNKSWALVTKMPLHDEHGVIIGTFGISRDITTLKQTEQELRQYREHLEELVNARTAELTQMVTETKRLNSRLQEEIVERQRIEQVLRISEQQYRLLAENVRDGIVIVQERTLVFANIVFATMVGYPSEQLLGDKLINLFHSQTEETISAWLEHGHGLNSDSQWQGELVSKNGRTLWTELEQATIIWNGQPALLLTIRDITDRKLREQHLEQERIRLQQENLSLKTGIKERYRFGPLVGKSPAMQHIYELIVSVAASDVNALIWGESGTGKELIALTIHQVSARKTQAFVAVNCASIPESLFEREFFGHLRGAFTGADRDKPGLFDRAHQGTLFLDEVTELSPGTQAKLLRVLQDGEYIPLGSNTPKQANVLIVAATNKDWKALIEQGKLRQDFFYRICVIEIPVPPLKDRKEDLPLLIEHILAQYRKKQEEIHRSVPHDLPANQTMLPGELVQALYAYYWPGNVRELQNVLQRYLATQDLPSVLSLISVPGSGPTVAAHRFISPQTPLPEAVKAFEKQMIIAMLEQNNHQVGKTAQILGIPRRTLTYKIKQYQLK